MAIERIDGRRAALAADLVANAVHDRAAQVGLQRTLAPGSKWSRLATLRISVSWTRSSVSETSRAHCGSRPDAHRLNLGKYLYQAVKRTGIPGAHAFQEELRRRQRRVTSLRCSVFQCASFEGVRG